MNDLSGFLTESLGFVGRCSTLGINKNKRKCLQNNNIPLRNAHGFRVWTGSIHQRDSSCMRRERKEIKREKERERKREREKETWFFWNFRE